MPESGAFTRKSFFSHQRKFGIFHFDSHRGDGFFSVRIVREDGWTVVLVMSSSINMPINKANTGGDGDSSDCCRSTSLPMETVADGNDEMAIQTAADAGNTSGRTPWTIGTKVIHRAFDDIALEELYQKYCQRSRESDLDCFFLTGCLVAVHSAVSFSLKQQDQDLQSRVLIGAGVSSVVAVAQASLGFYIRGRKKMKNPAEDDGGHQQAAAAAAAVVTSTSRLTYAAWLLANVLILGLLAVIPSSDQSTRALTWLLLINFLTCVTLPLRLRVCLLLTSITSLLFLVVSAFTSWDEAGIQRPTLHQQVVVVVVVAVLCSTHYTQFMPSHTTFFLDGLSFRLVRVSIFRF